MKTETTTKVLILEDLRRLAQSAYQWNSMDPDKAADRTIESYSEQLESDLNEMPEHERDRYKAGYRKYFIAWMVSLSRCASPMVTGPSNFPTERNRKRRDSEHKRQGEFYAFRNRALSAIARNQRRQDAPPIEQDLRENETVLKTDLYHVLKNYGLNRLQIVFPGKPDVAVIAELKGQAFRWAPSQGAWQRILTDNAIHAAKRVCYKIDQLQ